MSSKKDFAGAMNRLTSREVILGGDKNKATIANQPFGESLREQLEKEASSAPIREVALSQLIDNPFQKLARSSYDEGAMAELVSSIQQNGFYGALLARRRRGLLEQYELAFGHRRKEAARQAGITTLPVKIIELTDTQMARIMASENFAREDLTPLGEANVIGHLNIEQNLSAAEISKIVGKGEGWVKLRMALYAAPTDIKEMVRQRPETLGHIRLLLQVKDLAERSNFITEILTSSLTREELQNRLNTKSNTPLDNNTTSDFSQPLEDNVTNITSSLPYTNSENHNNQNTASVARPGEAKRSKAGASPEFRKRYKEHFKKLYQIVGELEDLRVSEEFGSSLTGAEKRELQILNDRISKLLG